MAKKEDIDFYNELVLNSRAAALKYMQGKDVKYCSAFLAILIAEMYKVLPVSEWIEMRDYLHEKASGMAILEMKDDK